MLTICWAAKGGSGTTVFVAATAVAAATPTLLIDLDGDLPSVLGIAEPDGPGVHDWLRSDAGASRLAAIECPVTNNLSMIARGSVGISPPARWDQLADHLRTETRIVIIDAGTGRPPDALRRVADRALVVTRSCYLSLLHAVAQGVVPTGVVLIEEPGRALRPSDVEASLGAPIVSTVLLDPAIARAVDAGLLASRLPGFFRRHARGAA